MCACLALAVACAVGRGMHVRVVTSTMSRAGVCCVGCFLLVCLSNLTYGYLPGMSPTVYMHMHTYIDMYVHICVYASVRYSVCTYLLPDITTYYMHDNSAQAPAWRTVKCCVVVLEDDRQLDEETGCVRYVCACAYFPSGNVCVVCVCVCVFLRFPRKCVLCCMQQYVHT